MKVFNYIKDIVLGVYRLCQGMRISLLNFFRPKVTDQYPENRGKYVYFERFRGVLTMPHNENNEHKCTACGICALNCPNGTIRIISKKVVDEATGKEKKALDKYQYNLGSCTFCAICTTSCPQDAIEWNNGFEHSVFQSGKLDKCLNKEGSSLIKKN